MREIKSIICIIIMITLLVGCSANDFLTVQKAKSEATEVSEDVPHNELPKIETQNLIINSSWDLYTYDSLEYDIKKLQEQYGNVLQIVKLCDTADGRAVYDVVLGDINGENQILIFGAMHAREYITSCVVMKQLCDCIDAVNGYGGEYNGIATKELLSGATIHFVPMSNPDGVTISQVGLDGLKNDKVKEYVRCISNGNYVQWKSNANGVDLNRNFDAGWNEFTGSGKPSSERYKGTAPGSELESAALINLTEKYKFKRTISYHTCGALIYWYYKQDGAVFEQSRDFADAISDETGYVLDSDYTSVDAAGYKDWAIYKKGIPSITIEVGNENGGGIVNPVPTSSFDAIWQRNKNVVYATICNMRVWQ